MDEFCQIVGEGKPLLFLHGWGCSGDVFLPTASLLKNKMCYLYDFYGFGKSPQVPQDGWTVQDYAESLHTFLQQKGMEQVDVVAHSFGCRVAMVLAVLYPNDVDKLLLVSPAGLRFFSIKRVVKVAKYKLHKMLVKLKLSSKKAVNYGSTDYQNCSGSLQKTFVKVVNQNLAKYAKKIDKEVLILNGKQDCQTTLKHAKRLNKLIKNSKLVALEGDHFVFFTDCNRSKNIVEFFFS